MSLPLPDPRLIRTSHGHYDLSRLSRSASLSKFEGVMDPVSHEYATNIEMPIAEKGANNSLQSRVYNLPDLDEWLRRNQTMPHNREDAGTALRKWVAVRWKEGRGNIHPPQGYDWVKTARALQELRNLYPPRQALGHDTNGGQNEEEEEESDEDEERPNPDEINYDDKYRQFRMQMLEVVRDPRNAPRWYTRYFWFYPECQKDRVLHIEFPADVVIPPPPVQDDNISAFRQEMARKLVERIWPYNNLHALVRAYWMVHPIILDRDDELTIRRYFENMPINIRIFRFPAFFLQQYNVDRDRYMQNNMLRN